MDHNSTTQDSSMLTHIICVVIPLRKVLFLFLNFWYQPSHRNKRERKTISKKLTISLTQIAECSSFVDKVVSPSIRRFRMSSPVQFSRSELFLFALILEKFLCLSALQSSFLILKLVIVRKAKFSKIVFHDSVIVPGPGSRSYRVPTLPDPTGYYYCTLQLGCRIVVAIYSVHLEVKLASSIDTCN